MLLANGCDLSGLVRCTPHAEATVTRWLEHMGAHSGRLHVRFFQYMLFPLLQLGELHTRVRQEGVQWVWMEKVARTGMITSFCPIDVPPSLPDE